jgi:nitrous oxidase accessory protein NosD
MGCRICIKIDRGGRRSARLRSSAVPLRLRSTLLLVAAALAACGGGEKAEAANCTSYASQTGSDSGSGTDSAPYRTVQRLVDSLGPGQTGCLRAGRYRGQVTFKRPGRPAKPITLRNAPGEKATVIGQVNVTLTADYVTVHGLSLDGSASPVCPRQATCGRLPSPNVNGDHVVFEDNDVTNHHRGICFGVGTPESVSVGLVIRRNRVHHCGRLPSTNYDHGVYLGYTRGARVIDNVIDHNADRGVQLFPAAYRTIVRGNVIDSNGVGLIFGGDPAGSSSGNLVENNVIARSRLRHDVESHYPAGAAPGRNNVVRRNCIFGGRAGEVADPIGFRLEGNTVADPAFRSFGGAGLQLPTAQACARLVLSGSR